MKTFEEGCFNNLVGVVRLEPRYSDMDSPEDHVHLALDRLALDLGWWDARRGLFGEAIPPGARVLIKPNFVMHENHGPWGIEPLITHPSLVRAATEAALRADAAEVLVGDAALQGCDWGRLMKRTGLDHWAEDLMKREPRFKGIQDFRRTTCTISNGVRVAAENLQAQSRFVLLDLGQNSLLEPISDERCAFRVTSYDPRLLANTHAPGKHQYLVAREVLEADVIVNLPKLKTHKKAGITCALKNLIGINGNKEYLPHHRVGGAEAGGDCYPGGNPVKRALEYSLDRQNTASSHTAAKLWSGVAVNLDRVARLAGDRFGAEGSWSGNDTIWRTCLDLNRILLYGRVDGGLSDRPQRRVIHLVDAVIAGHGDGPLSPQPLPMGVLLAGRNAGAVDSVGARLLGYDPERIPIAREAFGRFRWPITSGGLDDVLLAGDLGSGAVDVALREWMPQGSMTYPVGWLDAVR